MANLLSTAITGTATTSGSVVIGGTFANNAYNSVSSTRLMFGGGNEPNNYSIGTNLENYGGNYTKLDLRWHTGIRIGAQPGYGGVRFFSNETLASRIMSIGETDANVRIDNNLYIGGAGGWITDLLNAKYSTSGGTISGYVRINKNWGEGDFGAEQLTIYGTYPSITLRSTTHDSKWLIHNDSSVSFYYGAGASNNSWSRRFEIPQDGNIWMSWAGDYISNLLGAKQNASTAITTSNIGSQSVNYAATAGSASVATSAGSVDGLTINNSGNPINPDNVTQNQIGYNTSVSLYGQTDGGLYSSAYSSSWIHQIYGDFRTGQIAIRGKNAGTWQDWRYVLDDKNIGSYAVPYGNMTGSTGLNDNKLYLRTNGDNNHYLWNAADDWEELVYYTGTGFRIKGSTGVVAGYFTDSEVKLNARLTVGNFPQSTTNTGEAWVGRANDRNTGTLTVQLGGNSASSRSFEVVDYAWSTVLFSVNSNNTVSVNNYLEAGSSLRAPIFYDSNDTAFYVDPNSASRVRNLYVGDSGSNWVDTGGWGTQLHVSNGPHSIIRVYARDEAIQTVLFSHNGGQSKVGSGTNHDFAIVRNFSDRMIFYSGYTYANGYLQAADSLRAPIFYDSNDTGYYLDPNGTSNLNQLNTATRTRWNMPRYWTNRTIYSSDEGYWTGTNGWGVDHGNWANAWQGGFSGWDIWGTNTDHPQGSGYVHAQGIVSGQHYATSSVGYGWMMVGAANATDNRYWLRGKWDTTTSGWVEMITTGNIGSQSVNYAASAGDASTLGGFGRGNTTNKVAYFDGTRNLYVNNPESYTGEVRLGAAWSRGGVYASSTLSMATSGGAIDFVSNDTTIGAFRWDSTNGSRFIVGNNVTTTPYTLIDSNKRPVIYQRGAYPVLTLDHTETSNGVHGPTIQFVHNGYQGNQWVIGTNGPGTRLDIGFSNTAEFGNTSYNPHNGIGGYNGKTLVRMTSAGVAIGSLGTYPTVIEPAYTLDVRGNSYSSGNLKVDGFVNVNGATEHTVNDNGSVVHGTTTNNRVFINGSIQLTNNNDAIVIGRSASTFLTDEEIGFGWGGGWYMTDSTYLRVRGSKILYNDYIIRSDADMRAPIFYDSADTAYYLDPNGDTSLKVYGEISNSNYQTGRLQPGALNIGRTDTNYAWDGTSWADDIRLGILANCSETWEMAIHDSGDSVMSVVHYDGGNTLSFGRNLSWGNCYVNAQAGYISNSNPWGTNNSAFFPNGISTAGGTNWIYGFTYIGNAPGNGNGHEFNANGTQYSTTSITTPTFIVNNHSDNTRGYRIHNTSGTAVSAMFVNSSNQLVFAAGAVDQINLNKKVLVNGVALGVNVAPSATAGRIDASNDIVAYSSSDERLKHNITPIENAIDKVKSLTGVEFDWKPEYKHAHGYEGHDTGIIAQQVQEVIPSAVRTNDTGFLAVRYEKLIGLLIEANKELAARVEELEKKLG